MRQAEKNFRRLEAARRTIEPFEPVNPCQLEVKAILTVMMDHMERSYCQPGAPLDEERAFDHWMWRLKRGWRALQSPEMAGEQARAALAALLRQQSPLATLVCAPLARREERTSR